jgi:hypothetical protein
MATWFIFDHNIVLSYGCGQEQNRRQGEMQANC